jgi:23S rRNA (cytosine1962-C5)-methyltransferase
MARAELTAYRLVHDAADGFPGVAVDRFDDVVVVHAEPGAEVPDLRALGATGYVKIHPRQASRMPVRPSTQSAWGEPVERAMVLEHGARYVVKPAAGLSVGLFLDMREVRGWLREQSAGRTVLNLFAYTCSFGVSASLGGATRVLNLDLSKAYLAWGRENYALNDLPVDPRDFVFGDALDWLARFGRRGERFDLVLVDPPSFSTTGRRAFSVERDYAALMEAAAQVVASRGILVAATNHAGISATRFDSFVARGLRDAGREGRLMERWHEPDIDFPVPPGGHPYLQVLALALD